MQRIEFRAMNCQMLAIVDSDLAESEAAELAAALATVPDWFEGWEQCLSRFRPDSELSMLNQHQGQWVDVGADLFGVIEVARAAAAFSNGMVSPALLTALEDAGYDRSFELLNPNRVERPLQDTAARCVDWHDIGMDAVAQRVYLPAGMRLDLGGVAKGWAAEQAATRLSQFGAALMDAGGDISMQGTRALDEPWPIGIADPHHPDEVLDTLLIRSGNVATSGRDYRRWWIEGSGADTRIWQHHILDPRTGRPAQTDVMSATVVTPHMMWAEAAAKTALILGSGAGLEWIEARPELAATLVLEDGQVLHSQRMSEYTWK